MEVFPFKNLEPSYKTELGFWDWFGWEKAVKAGFHEINLQILGHFLGRKTVLKPNEYSSLG